MYMLGIHDDDAKWWYIHGKIKYYFFYLFGQKSFPLPKFRLKSMNSAGCSAVYKAQTRNPNVQKAGFLIVELGAK